MIRTVALGMCLVASAAQADASERFEKLRQSSQAVGGLGAFLEKYIGDDCEDVACKSNAERFRREASGKKFYMLVSEDSDSMLSPGRIDTDNGEFTLNITPFFPASAYALTHGKPKKTDGNGNPVMSFLSLRAPIPDGENESGIARLFRTRAFKLQVIFTPQTLWALPKKGGGKNLGVQAKIHAILVTNGRTGEDVGLWTSN